MSRPLFVPIVLALAAPLASAADGPTAAPPTWAPTVSQPWAQAQDDWRTTEVRTETRETGSDAGAYVLLGGGIEGYTSDLADQVSVGPAAGLTVGVKSRMLGLEAAVNGAGLNVNDDAGGDAGNGFDITRTTAQLAATVGLLPTRIQPFILGGAALDFYNVRNGEARGFDDETGFALPVGAGLRYNLTRLVTADLRGQYDFMLGDNFAPDTTDNGDRYTALLSLGGTF